MENPKKISKKELVAKYKPIGKVSLPKWQYRSSIKRILKREMSTNGKLIYNVQLLNNETTNVPALQLERIYSNLVQDFEKRLEQSKSDNKEISRRSNRHVQRIESSSEESSNYSSSDNDGDDSSDENVDEKEAPLKTRSGRTQVAPKSFQQEFYAMFENAPRKAPKEKYRHVPAYTDKCIDLHSQYCYRCLKTGHPNGQKRDALDVACGPTCTRTRLLLCQTCSLACHNNCLPVKNDTYFDKDNQFCCPKCNTNKSGCEVCHKSIQKDQSVPFRCKICYRCFHSTCINSDMYDEGSCHDCLTFEGRQPKSIVAQRTTEKGEKEMLIVWKDKSYRHVTWVSATWIQALHTTLASSFKKKHGDEDTEAKKGRYFPIEWITIERVLNVEWKDKAKEHVSKVLVVFKDSDYGDALWDDPPSEDEPELYAAYQLALKRYIRATKVKPPQKVKQLIADIRRLANAEKYEYHELKAQPKYIDGGILMKHQLDALNWLLFQWEKEQSCVLADDMGLGKTIQVVSFLYVLFKKYNIYPFIVVVPNSTATNWIREFQKWAPEMSVVPFFGLSASRELALDNEIFDKHMNLKCHAIVATYESIQESTKIQNIFWPVMIVDESQRLKNDESLLFKALKRFHKGHSILMTGTPLQNNLKELFNIMNFIRPDDFHYTQAEDYDEMTREQVDELHSRLRPYFLRRTKEEILKTLPPKHEIIVPLSMSPLQKEVYKSCLSRDIENILGASNYKRAKGMNSIFMNLRKTLNHPYLIDGVETPQKSPEETQRAMINACEKLKFFHQMLPKIRAQGHRVLIFSTMTRALDVIDDYLIYEDIPFVRLDGSDSERVRVRSIDAFNAPNSKIDVFLLSTRAGGVGINLATADTVIIWDSDFNPYADLQAISRAHRIGQTKMVLIYRFMTRSTVEERILQIGKGKMALEHVVVEKMSSEEDTIEDIESILKFGAKALFDNDESPEITYDSAAMDRLLDREQYKALAEAEKEKEIAEAEEKKNSFGFSYASVWKAEGGAEDLTETAVDEEAADDFWEKFLKNKQEEVERKKAEKRIHDMNLGRGARKRAQVSYSEKSFNDAEKRKQKKNNGKDNVDHDDEYSFSDTEDVDVEDVGEVTTGQDELKEQADTPKIKKVRSRKKQTLQSSQLATYLIDTNQASTSQPKQTQAMPETMLQISPDYPEQLNAAIQTIFERHCKTVYDYLVACGRDGVSSDYYQAMIAAGVQQLANSLRVEFRKSIDFENQKLRDANVSPNTLKQYIKTKTVIFESILNGSIVQFDRWKLHNEPLLTNMGSRMRIQNGPQEQGHSLPVKQDSAFRNIPPSYYQSLSQPPAQNTNASIIPLQQPQHNLAVGSPQQLQQSQNNSRPVQQNLQYSTPDAARQTQNAKAQVPSLEIFQHSFPVTSKETQRAAQNDTPDSARSTLNTKAPAPSLQSLQHNFLVAQQSVPARNASVSQPQYIPAGPSRQPQLMQSRLAPSHSQQQSQHNPAIASQPTQNSNAPVSLHQNVQESDSKDIFRNK